MKRGAFFMGEKDMVKITSVKKIKQLFDKNGEKIQFSAPAQKINDVGKVQDRIVAITNKYFYNIRKETIKRQIELKKITGLVYSTKCLQFIVKVSTEYDYRYIANSKEQRNTIIGVILREYQKLMQQKLIVYTLNDVDLEEYVDTEKNNKKGKPRIVIQEGGKGMSEDDFVEVWAAKKAEFLEKKAAEQEKFRNFERQYTIQPKKQMFDDDEDENFNLRNTTIENPSEHDFDFQQRRDRTNTEVIGNQKLKIDLTSTYGQRVLQQMQANGQGPDSSGSSCNTSLNVSQIRGFQKSSDSLQGNTLKKLLDDPETKKKLNYIQEEEQEQLQQEIQEKENQKIKEQMEDEERRQKELEFEKQKQILEEEARKLREEEEQKKREEEEKKRLEEERKKREEKLKEEQRLLEEKLKQEKIREQNNQRIRLLQQQQLQEEQRQKKQIEILTDRIIEIVQENQEIQSEIDVAQKKNDTIDIDYQIERYELELKMLQEQEIDIDNKLEEAQDQNIRDLNTDLVQSENQLQILQGMLRDLEESEPYKQMPNYERAFQSYKFNDQIGSTKTISEYLIEHDEEYNPNEEFESKQQSINALAMQGIRETLPKFPQIVSNDPNDQYINTINEYDQGSLMQSFMEPPSQFQGQEEEEIKDFNTRQDSSKKKGPCS